MSIESPRRGLTLIGLPPRYAYSSFLLSVGDAKLSCCLGGDLCNFLGDLYPFLLLLGYSLTLTAYEKLTDLFIREGELSICGSQCSDNFLGSSK